MQKLLEQVVDYITRIADAERVYLFGSVATGRNNVHSDLDLLVVTNDDQKETLQRCIRSFIAEFAVAADVIVMDRESLEKIMKQQESFLFNALKKSKIIYEKRSENTCKK